MILSELNELRARMAELDGRCYDALKELAREDTAGPSQGLLQNIAENLEQLEGAYGRFLRELCVSGVEPSEADWHRKDVRLRHRAISILIEDELGLRSPMKSFGEILEEAVFHGTMPIAGPGARGPVRVGQPRQEPTVVTRPSMRGRESYTLHCAAVWGRLELDWLMQHPASRKNIEELRERRGGGRTST